MVTSAGGGRNGSTAVILSKVRSSSNSTNTQSVLSKEQTAVIHKEKHLRLVQPLSSLCINLARLLDVSQ